MALTRVDFSASLASIRNPTLVMAGGLDVTTPVALVRELAAGITGAKFQEIPGCGHCPQIEKPAEFVAASRHSCANSEPGLRLLRRLLLDGGHTNITRWVLPPATCTAWRLTEPSLSAVTV
jgi:hypothetical protein